MELELQILSEIKKLVTSNGNEIMNDQLTVYKTASPNEYKVSFNFKKLTFNDFRYLHVVELENSNDILVKFPEDEECNRLISLLDSESVKEYTSLSELGNTTLSKIGLGFLIIT
jgi:hypothetical protein